VDWGKLHVRPWSARQLEKRLKSLFEQVEPDLIVIPQTLDSRRGRIARQTLITIKLVATECATPIRCVGEKELDMPQGPKYQKAQLAMDLFVELHAPMRPRSPGGSEDGKVAIYLVALMGRVPFSPPAKKER
jgi:hypothetical protein